MSLFSSSKHVNLKKKITFPLLKSTFSVFFKEIHSQRSIHFGRTVVAEGGFWDDALASVLWPRGVWKGPCPAE